MVTIDTDNSEFLKATEFFDINNSRVRRKALEITSGFENDIVKAKALFYWVRDNIKYNMMAYNPKLKANFKASVTLRRKYGFCVSKSILLSSMARVVKIPSRIHLVDLINHKISQKVIDFMGTIVMYYHGYSELLLNGHWIKFTPSFDPETAMKGKFLPMVEFDGVHDAIFPKFDLDGNLFGEYVQDRGTHSDLPLQEIDELFSIKYGKIFNKM
jgi:hypothetical protein